MVGTKLAAASLISLSFLSAGCGEKQVSFKSDVEPILAARCASCRAVSATLSSFATGAGTCRRSSAFWNGTTRLFASSMQLVLRFIRFWHLGATAGLSSSAETRVGKPPVPPTNSREMKY